MHLLKMKLYSPLVAIMGIMLLIPQTYTLPAITHESPKAYSQSIIRSLSNYNFKQPNLEDTINEVQKILSSDPSLPRLTRGEIEELYEKVTREEYEKSVEAGDVGRADSMRALMLVLPYNTDNNTEENLQDLYTRPPVTKVIDTYTPPQPIKFISPDPNAVTKTEHSLAIEHLAATTYKPSFQLRKTLPNPTTYHPYQPAAEQFQPMYETGTASRTGFQPITSTPQHYDFATNLQQLQTPKPVHRFSSHYNAKNTDFLKFVNKKSSTTTVKPVADILQSLGIVNEQMQNQRNAYDDYYLSESAPKPVVSSYIPQTINVAELKALRPQSDIPRIHPDAYTNFKPLNIGEEIRVKPEVEGYLTRFGIVGGRKRKNLQKNKATMDASKILIAEETAKLPATVKTKKSAPNRETIELQKLIENLQELERLNVKPKLSVAAQKNYKPVTTTTTTSAPTTTTTTTTTTSAPSTNTLITNGAPMLIEPKKPRRRIDPTFDINYGASSNHQVVNTNTDELSKLLENLQELEKLQINPENVLKRVTPQIKPATAATLPPSTELRTQTLINRFNEANGQSALAQPTVNEQIRAQELELVLKQLQAVERANAKTTSTTMKPTTKATTKRPQQRNNFLPSELFEIQQLLANERELERLYDQARARVKQKPTTTSTTTSTTTTTTTQKPKPMTQNNEFEQIQKYLQELERSRLQSAKTTATTSTSTTTTTTTTTVKPTVNKTQFAQQIATSAVESNKLPSGDAAQLEALLNRVEQLENINNQQLKKPTETSSQQQFQGFTSRNIKQQAIENGYERPSNDFAQLQQLYKQMDELKPSAMGQIEIATAATTGRRTQNRTNSPDNNLQQVDPNEFVQLQKLLSKVQELERVKINTVDKYTPKVLNTAAPNLVTAASTQASSIHTRNSPQIVYDNQKKNPYQEFDENEFDELKLDLPIYQMARPDRPQQVSKRDEARFDIPTSSEELREYAYSQSANPMMSKTTLQEYTQFHNLFSSLADNERNAYKNMEPPIIKKIATLAKEPPHFVATKKPQNSTAKQDDLQELQKLVNNAQQLEKLGVTLPTELSEQIETKLMTTQTAESISKQTTNTIGTAPTTVNVLRDFEVTNAVKDITDEKYKTFSTTNRLNAQEPEHKTVVFSLTTMKSLVPKELKPVTETSLELPVFSATKIIEDAIKRAATKIGVSTEKSNGFQRRNDMDIFESGTSNEDLMGEFSELNYQLAPLSQTADEPVTVSTQRSELQRLIGNLQELQKLNISISPSILHQADTKYLETFQIADGTDELKKNRRQSANATEITATVDADLKKAADVYTTMAPTRISLNVNLNNNADSNAQSSSSDAITTTTSTAITTTTTTTRTTEGTTTTEESRNGSLDDLADSFGPDPNTENPLPPKKKNGFYFLADWNSFLEVGDGDDQVVVRLSPKIGDPRLFLPVKIP